MGTSHRKLAVLLVGAAALTFSPVAVPNWSGDLVGIAGAEAKEGRGGGGDRGGGNGRGGGSENRGSSENRGGGKDRSDHGGRGGGKTQAEQGGPAKSWQFWRKEERKPVKAARAPATKPAKPVPLPVAKALPEEPPAPKAKPEKPLAAKLGGLNSLKRNPTAILNSADPRMAAFREILLADEALKAADQAVQEAIDGWREGATLDEVKDRITELETMGIAEDDPELKQLKEIAALADEAEKAAGELAAAVSDEALTEALLAGANPNKVAAYGGEEAYVDQEMLDWTRDTLGLSEPEVAVEPDPDVAEETDPDTGSDPDPDVAGEPDPEAEPDPDVAEETDPDSGSDPEPEVAGEPEPDPILEPEPAG